MARNVLLVVLDSARVHNMGVYGYRRDTTPFLSSIADDATVYEQARAPAVWSVPSHVSMFSGLHVEEHGVLNDEYEFSLEDEGLFSRLSSAGYDTGLFSGNAFLTSLESGLQDGFDDVWRSPRASPHLFDEGMDPDWFVGEYGEGSYLKFLDTAWNHDYPLRSILNGVASKLEYHTDISISGRREETAFDYVQAFSDWISGRSEWAACINLMDTHAPYRPSEEFDRWGTELARKKQGNVDRLQATFGDYDGWSLSLIQNLYDGTILQADTAVRELLETTPDDTLVILTADHGEGFGEYSHITGRPSVGHSFDLHEVQTHVPLLVIDPENETGSRVEQPVSLVDIPDLVLDSLNLESKPVVFDSPVITHTGKPFSRRASRVHNEWPNVSLNTGWAVYTGGEALSKTVHWGEKKQTHILETETDFDETEHRRVSEELGPKSQLTQADSETDLDEATAERLEELGYM